VFAIDGNEYKFIDRNKRAYTSFDVYKNTNTLPKSAMLYPRNGKYTPDENNEDKRVILEVGESPDAKLDERVLAVAKSVVTVAGIVMSVSGVVTFFAPTLLNSTVMAVRQAGSFILAGHSFSRQISGNISQFCAIYYHI
jgi:hypothetical protein